MNIPTAPEIQIPTGISGLDALAFSALRPGHLVAIAGRPGHGASTLALNIARHAAVRNGIPTRMITLETVADNMLHRVVAAESSIPVVRVVKGTVTDDDVKRFDARMDAIAAAPLEITNEPRSLGGIVDLLAKNEIRLLVIDGAHLLDTGIDDEGNPEYRADDIAHALKRLSMQSGTAIVVTLPLLPGSGHPRMDDLGDRYTFAYDADLVVLMHRPEVDNPGSDRVAEVDLIIAKQRNGPAGNVTACMQTHYARILDMAKPHES